MGLINGSVSCTRYTILSMPEDLDFSICPFFPIQKGTYTRQSCGFVPFNSDQIYELGKSRYGFRFRIDKVQVDATQVKEKLRVLIETEEKMSGKRVHKKKIRELKELAEDAVYSESSPKTTIIEGYIDQLTLTVGTTSKSQLGTVIGYLRRLGVEVEFKTPWFESPISLEPPVWMEFKDPAQHYAGCLFLKSLREDSSIYIEGVQGSAKLTSPEGIKVSLQGVLGNELNRLVDEDEAEILSAKLQIGDTPLTLDGSTFRISSMKVRNCRSEHWTQRLETRMELIDSIFEVLESKFAKFKAEEGLVTCVSN